VYSGGLVLSFYRWDDIPEEKLTDLLSRKLVVGKNEMLALVTLRKGAFVTAHRHESEQITFILKGALKFLVGGREIVVREGGLLHLPSNMEHSATALEDTLDLDVFSPIRKDWLDGSDSYLRK
jgi:quercetin dioxygenase-like cupin family protein